MNNLRLTIVMFLLAAALAPALIFGLGTGRGDGAAGSGTPIDPAVFRPAGLNAAPWLGSSRAKSPHDDPGRPASPDAAATGSSAARPVTVVELFTSEGCSSCPPADRLLSDLMREHARDPSVFLLAFHVDYWDHLGWKDPFAGHAATARQRAYAPRLGDERLYTPQMVVNGERGFVGSDGTRAREAIDASRRDRDRQAVSVSGWRDPIVAGGPVRVECTVAAPKDRPSAAALALTACLVEDGLTSRVTRGENQGRELRHDRVVRTMAQADGAPGERMVLHLDVPSGVKPTHAAVVVLVQDRSTLRVLGAAELAPREPEKPATGAPAPQRDGGR